MGKRPIEPIEGRRVSLRLLSEADLPMTLAWRNQDRVRIGFITSRILTEREHREWFSFYSLRDDDFVFVILDRRAGDQPIGQVSVYNIDWKARTAEFGRLMIGEDSALGQGLASEAAGAIVEFAFRQLGLSELHLEVFKTNGRAIAIYRRHGFTDTDERDALLRMVLKASAPRHTAILGSYNRPVMVQRAIRSVLGQTFADVQLIVTDDGSNSETIAAIRKTTANDPRCILLTIPHIDDSSQRPDCANRAVQRINDAIPHVRGAIVHYLADDDWYHEERFAVFDEVFRDPQICAAYGRLAYVDAAGAPLGRTRFPDQVSDPLGTLDHNQVCHRREIFERIPRWADAVDYASEGHFFRAIGRIWRFHGIDRVVGYKTEHAFCMTTTQVHSTGQRES